MVASLVTHSSQMNVSIRLGDGLLLQRARRMNARARGVGSRADKGRFGLSSISGGMPMFSVALSSTNCCHGGNFLADNRLGRRRMMTMAASRGGATQAGAEKELMKLTKAELVELVLDLRKEKEFLEDEIALYNPKMTITRDRSSSSSSSMELEDDAMTMSAVEMQAQYDKELDFDSKEALIQALKDGIAWPDKQDGEFWTKAARIDSGIALSQELHDAPRSLNGSQRSVDGNYKLHIVHVTAEMAPLAKVGGLGDVVTGLGAASLRQGHSVDVILPFYECIDTTKVEGLTLEKTFESPTAHDSNDGGLHISSVRMEAYRGKIEGCPVILLKPVDVPFFRGGAIYGGSYNETQAYLIFCRASLEYMAQSGIQPNIIHAHEWQGAAVPMLFWELYSSRLPSARPILTIHNMDNTGECRQDEFAATGVPGSLFASVDKALDERTIGHNPERLCLLKGGVIYSSAVTTVSPTYAHETLTGGSAGFLQSTLARPEVASKYMGILNGIDTDIWNPAIDPYLPACFSSHVPEGKMLCKKYLQSGLGLEESEDKPLVAVISRLVPQKGIHLIEHAAVKTVESGGQFVLLGTGHASGGLQSLANDRYRDNKNVSMMFMYSEALSHLIYAAADIFLVPSMFEPCGLTQMIALRYGGVPVVRRTGGLADTVRDVEQHGIPSFSEEVDLGTPMRGNGFVFDGVDAGAIDTTLERAFNMYKSAPDDWKALSKNNMKDSAVFSWDGSGASYEQLYLGVTQQ
jgi:starch synthase